MTVCDAAGWISITRNPWTPRPTRFSEGNTGAGQLDQVAGRTGENAFQISAMADDFAGLIEPQGLPANWPR
jgi:hypothetical protein